MTTPSEAEQIIFNHWLTNWVVDGQPRTETNLESENIPNGVRIGEDSWVYLYVQEIRRRQLSHGPVGSRKFLQRSQAVVAIFVPQGRGTKLATDLSHEARSVFEGVRLDPLKNFAYGDIVRVGAKPPEYQINVIVPFEYTEVK